MPVWLYKTEPSEFSINDLKRDGQVRWDEVRNYGARNYLCQGAVGDTVLIYHSSCAQVGIVGVARIIQPAYPDPAQFDEGSPYYDPKSSPERPRWFCVDIAYVETLPKIIPLKVIKQSQLLSNLALLKQPRLSVQPVSREHYTHLMALSLRPQSSNDCVLDP